MLKKIAITGPESTGKSWLAEKLSRHFRCYWVPEYARSYLDAINRPYKESDLLNIAKGQVQNEDKFSRKSSGFLFCDTELIVIKIWSEVKYGKCHPWIINEIAQRKYSLFLLMDTDLPWEPDPQREHPKQRDYLFGLYQNELVSRNLPFKVISGFQGDRLENAIQAIHELM